MKLTVYNKKREDIDAIEVDDRLFGVDWNPSLVQQVLQSQRANRRQPWAHAKDRSEVRGGGRKPWRQKGTGRARHGSIRSPIWVGGGKAHGPHSEKAYRKKINKKMRRLAVRSVLSRKYSDKEVNVVDALEMKELKAKHASQLLHQLLQRENEKKPFDVLIVRDPEHKHLTRAVRNLKKAYVVDPSNLTVEDLLSYQTIIFEKNALQHLSYLYE